MLTRHQRITDSADYARLFTAAATGHGALLTVKVQPADDSRAGIIVSKKAAPLATDRNRIKRRLRAILREELEKLPVNQEIVVIAKAPARQADSAALSVDLQAALTRAQRKAV
jgi:ribonuclease P protein component